MVGGGSEGVGGDTVGQTHSNGSPQDGDRSPNRSRGRWYSADACGVCWPGPPDDLGVAPGGWTRGEMPVLPKATHRAAVRDHGEVGPT